VRQRPITLPMLILVLGGCSTWNPVAPSPREYIESARPSWVRVYYAEGQGQILKHPWVRGDSILEQGSLCTNGKCVARNASAPLEGITRLDARRTSVPRTTLFVSGLSFGALVFAFVVSGGLDFSLGG